MYIITTCLCHLSKVVLYTRKIKAQHVQIVEANLRCPVIKVRLRVKVKKVEIEVEVEVEVKARKVKPFENNYSV
jgi:hypothetical protein